VVVEVVMPASGLEADHPEAVMLLVVFHKKLMVAPAVPTLIPVKVASWLGLSLSPQE